MIGFLAQLDAWITFTFYVHLESKSKYRHDSNEFKCNKKRMSNQLKNKIKNKINRKEKKYLKIIFAN